MIIHDYPFTKIGYIEEPKNNEPFRIKTMAGLQKYQEPSYTAKIIGSVSNGEVLGILKTSQEWGCLDDNSWINLTHTKRL